MPGWGFLAEGGAMGEGFGDYLAGSMSIDVNPTFQPWQVFDWDRGPVDNFWPGRRLDGTKHYPEDLDGEVHRRRRDLVGGLLADRATRSGCSTFDQILLESQFDVPTTGTMVDGGKAIVAADQNLNGGAHVGTIVYYMDLRGILNAADYIPSITHTPLCDTEDTIGPYVVTALIRAGRPRSIRTRFFTIYRVDAGSWTSLLMTATGNPNEYCGVDPGPARRIRCRLLHRGHRQRRTGGRRIPLGAPASFHTFHVGADTMPPVITHTALANHPLIQWPASRARAGDRQPRCRERGRRVDAQRLCPRPAFALVREGSTDYYSALFPVGAPPVADRGLRSAT